MSEIIVELSMGEVHNRSMERYFGWIKACCDELGFPPERGEELLQDECWFYCFDDGFTPKEAVALAIENGAIEPVTIGGKDV